MNTLVGATVHIATVIGHHYPARRRNPMPDHDRMFEANVAKDGAGVRAAVRGLIRLARIDTASGIRRRERLAG